MGYLGTLSRVYYKGPLVDKSTLLDPLEKGKIRGAAADLYAIELSLKKSC
jgi:phosphoglycerate dehydrogenase-like enzyme